MAVYMITYDLNNAGKKYDEVIQAIKDASTGVWCTYWKSTWLIRSSFSSAQDVSDKITPHLDSDDRCLVIEVKNNKQGWLSEDQWNYINNSIFG